jgi:hypothetical protein
LLEFDFWQAALDGSFYIFSNMITLYLEIDKKSEEFPNEYD